MTDTTFKAVDKDGAERDFLAQDNGGSITPYRKEDAAQRVALLAQLALLATAAQVGEVAASPTANTVQDRLKTGNATLASLLAALGEVAASPTANTALDRIKTTNTTLAAILAAIQAQRSETLWTDDTGAFFVRLDAGGTLSWTDLSGNPSSAPGTGARPASGTSAVVDRSAYQATAGGTGFSTGDLLDHFVTTDPATGAVLGHFWLNATTEAKLAAPPSAGSITPLSPLPSGAATSAKQDVAHTDLVNLLTQIVLAGGEAHIGNLGGEAKVWQAADAALTRPANTTAYAAHGGVGSSSSCIFKFTNFFRKNGNTGLLTGLRLMASGSGIGVSNMGSVRAHLYAASPSSPPSADQQTFNTLAANEAIKLGFVDFLQWNIGGSGSDMISSYGTPSITPLPIAAASGARDLYLVLEATAAFTPLSAAVIQAFASATLD